MAEVFEYRHNVDERMTRLMDDFERSATAEELARIVELGIHHEQQHQELLLTDIKHMFSCNPCCPAYRQLPEPHCAVEFRNRTMVCL